MDMIVPYPFYISEFFGKPFHVDLLLHNGHYYLITSMSSFVSSCSKLNQRKCYVCQYCQCYFVKKDRYDLHLKLCTKAGHQYSIPEKDCAFLKFSNYKNMVPAPFVMYCDLETMITSQIVINRGKTKINAFTDLFFFLEL